MSLGISKAYLGGAVGHSRLIQRATASSASAVCTRHALSFPARGYASAQLKKKKGASKPKSDTVDVLAEERERQKKATEATGQTPAKLTLDEENAKKVEEVERMMAYQHLMPTVDPWGQPVMDTLDVIIPTPLTFGAMKDPKNLLKILRENFGNSLKNWSTLSLLAAHNAIPGKSSSDLSWWQQAKLVMQCFGTRSTKPGAMVAPLREIALESYKELNNALAERNVKEINRLTGGNFNQQVNSMVKTQKKNSKGRMIWTLHRTLEPVRIISIRAAEGYVAPNAPRFGNRLMTHALVKFDTEQSLEIYDARGTPLHEPAPKSQSKDTTTPIEKWRTPAKPKRVTEYLVLEKLGWTPSPWKFREQMW